MVWYGIIWCYDIVRVEGMLWYELEVWDGVSWYGIRWHGMVRGGMVWYKVACYRTRWHGMVRGGMAGVGGNIKPIPHFRRLPSPRSLLRLTKYFIKHFLPLFHPFLKKMFFKSTTPIMLQINKTDHNKLKRRGWC